MAALEPPDGFPEFVVACADRLLRTAWLLTGDDGRAEDLLQTALAATWRRWRAAIADGNPEAYVRRALVTTYVSWWRRRWRGEIPTAALPDMRSDVDMATAVADRDAVRRALSRLSRQQRAVVVLRYAEDLSIEDTARALGCSQSTVKVQSARALAALRADPHLRSTEEVWR